MPDSGSQIGKLNQTIHELQVRLAEVSAEYAELIHVLAPFLNRYQTEILDPHSDLVKVKRRIADVRAMLGDEGARDSGTADTPLNQLVEPDWASVQEQYERVWRGKKAPSTELDLSQVLPPASEQLQDYYRLIIARKHPALSTTAEDKERRQSFLSQVNYSYVRRNETALGAVAEALSDRSDLPAVIDDNAVKEARATIYRLEKAIQNVEGQIFELRHGDVAKVRANAQLAHAEGRDLMVELNRAILDDLTRNQSQLESLEQQLDS